VNLLSPRLVRHPLLGELICLASISLAIIQCGSWNRTRIKITNRASSATINPDTYRLRYESFQLYGCEPEELGAAQLARVNRWCRCVQSINKYSECGLDLTFRECRW